MFVNIFHMIELKIGGFKFLSLMEMIFTCFLQFEDSELIKKKYKKFNYIFLLTHYIFHVKVY